jgi:hypothetical protein
MLSKDQQGEIKMKKEYISVLKENAIKYRPVKTKKVLKEAIHLPFEKFKELRIVKLSEDIFNILNRKTIQSLEELKTSRDILIAAGEKYKKQFVVKYKVTYSPSQISEFKAAVDSEVAKGTSVLNARIAAVEAAKPKVSVGGAIKEIPPGFVKFFKGTLVVAATILATYIIAAAYFIFKDSKEKKEKELARQGTSKEEASARARILALDKQINALRNSGNNFKMSADPIKTKNIIIKKIKELSITKRNLENKLRKK